MSIRSSPAPYRRQHGLNIKIARIFNTYGPRMHVDDGRVISNFAVQALGGEAAPLVSLDAGLCKIVDYFCLCKSRS
jgi:nucleoside-diphosphate-sugar epimerase